MTAPLKITRVSATTPPAYEGEWDGRIIMIKLDTSAVMRLEGNQGFNDQPIEWMAKAPIVGRAAERILQQHRNRGLTSGIVVSALDLNPQ